MRELAQAVADSARCGYHGCQGGKGKGKGGEVRRIGWIARLKAAAEAREPIFAAEENAFRQRLAREALEKAARERRAQPRHRTFA